MEMPKTMVEAAAVKPTVMEPGKPAAVKPPTTAVKSPASTTAMIGIGPPLAE